MINIYLTRSDAYAYLYNRRYLTHGVIDIQKIKDWEKEYALETDDVLIICGDFGGVWYGDDRDNEELDMWAEKPYTILFVDGNHENHDALATYPVVEVYGGAAHKIRPNLYHLMRGEIFTVEGKTFFAMGGARSTDRHLRTPYLDWWPDEMPSKQEYDHAISNLEECEWKVDYIISHCADSHALWKIDKFFNNDELTKFFAFIKDMYYLEYDKHFFGHYHLDAEIDDKNIAVYNKVIRVI